MSAAPEIPPSVDEEPLQRMSFGDHLEELRRRVSRALVAIGVCMLVMVPFKDAVSAVYLAPYRSMWREGFTDYLTKFDAEIEAMGGREGLGSDLRGGLYRERVEFLDAHREAILDGSFPFREFGDKIRGSGGYQVPYYLVALGGIEDFWTFMTATFLFSLIVASPIVLYQLWAFIGAGLYRQERRTVMMYLPGAIGLLASGVAFGYYLVVPYGLHFLVKLMNFGYVQPMFSVSSYFGLLFMMTAALGVAFQLPMVMLALNKVGLVSHRTFRRNWRYVLLGMFVVSAFVTPPDPFTQVMMAVPMIGLYGLGLALTLRAEAKAERTAA
ncbi:MAG: twin-arginine translocase subunit TatC [Planctomycetota bacterium]